MLNQKPKLNSGLTSLLILMWQELKKLGLGSEVDLHVSEVPVEYQTVQSLVPSLWKQHRPLVRWEHVRLVVFATLWLTHSFQAYVQVLVGASLFKSLAWTIGLNMFLLDAISGIQVFSLRCVFSLCYMLLCNIFRLVILCHMSQLSKSCFNMQKSMRDTL